MRSRSRGGGVSVRKRCSRGESALSEGGARVRTGACSRRSGSRRPSRRSAGSAIASSASPVSIVVSRWMPTCTVGTPNRSAATAEANSHVSRTITSGRNARPWRDHPRQRGRGVEADEQLLQRVHSPGDCGVKTGAHAAARPGAESRRAHGSSLRGTGAAKRTVCPAASSSAGERATGRHAPRPGYSRTGCASSSPDVTAVRPIPAVGSRDHPVPTGSRRFCDHAR